jgi:hypothetical protein
LSVRLIGCVCVGFVWLLGGVVRVLRRRDGTGRRLNLVCCLDASIVRRTLESRTVLCAAGTRPPSDVAFRSAMRRACGAGGAVEGAAMGLGMGCGWCAGGEVCGMGPCGDG